MSQDPMTSIPIPCFQGRARGKSHDGGNYPTSMTGVQNHAGGIGTFSHNGMMNYPGYQSPELHLGKFPDRTEFQSWKVNFRTEVCSKAKDSQLTMQWIKKIEKAKSIDELMTPRSILGREDFPDYDMMEAMMASALKKLSDKHTLFRKRGSLEEQRAHEIRPILEKEADCLYDLRACSFQLDLMMVLTGYQIFSENAYKMMTSKISMYAGSKQYYHPVMFLQIRSWKTCTSQNCRSLLSVRLHWHCTTKKRFEMENNQTITD